MMYSSTLRMVSGCICHSGVDWDTVLEQEIQHPPWPFFGKWSINDLGIWHIDQYKESDSSQYVSHFLLYSLFTEVDGKSLF